MPETHAGEVALHLRGNPMEQIMALFLFGGGGGGAGLLREVQFSSKAWHVFVLPSVQDAPGLLSRTCSVRPRRVFENLRLLGIVHTLVGLSAWFLCFSKK